MENQMKVCFVTRDQYNVLWTKSMPQERFATDLPTLALMSRKLNTLYIVGKQEDFLVDAKDSLPSTWFPELRSKFWSEKCQ
jgi:hypothetical protein